MYGMCKRNQFVLFLCFPFILLADSFDFQFLHTENISNSAVKHMEFDDKGS